MSEGFTERTGRLLGEAAVARLAAARVAVFGLGGVGGAAAEALARAGVGALTLFDADRVAPSNRNRQVLALCSTEGRLKTEVMASRIADINPACRVEAHAVFYLPELAEEYPFAGYDYIVDAVDTVAAKLEIICRAAAAGVPVISAMGAAGKLYPERFRVAKMEDTRVCPLARVMRRELKKRGVFGVKAVYSDEEPRLPAAGWAAGEKPVPGTVSFVPAAAGLVLAGEVVRELVGVT